MKKQFFAIVKVKDDYNKADDSYTTVEVKVDEKKGIVLYEGQKHTFLSEWNPSDCVKGWFWHGYKKLTIVDNNMAGREDEMMDIYNEAKDSEYPDLVYNLKFFLTSLDETEDKEGAEDFLLEVGLITRDMEDIPLWYSFKRESFRMAVAWWQGYFEAKK